MIFTFLVCLGFLAIKFLFLFYMHHVEIQSQSWSFYVIEV